LPTTDDGPDVSSDPAIAHGGQPSVVSGQPLRGVYVLSAGDAQTSICRRRQRSSSPLVQQVQIWSTQGMRVLLFAYNPEGISLHDGRSSPNCPL
jgi:hypothetical protein